MEETGKCGSSDSQSIHVLWSYREAGVGCIIELMLPQRTRASEERKLPEGNCYSHPWEGGGQQEAQAAESWLGKK